ncbi:MAG: hypothetical protein R6V01_05295 [Thermoplasmatota archaeon]
MKYGDKDGFREIYDEDGELILGQNEKKLVVEENVIPTLKSTWRYYGGDYLLEPSKGTIYLTNERLVFINIPERMFAIGGEDESRAMSTSKKSNFELGDSASGGALREYFEIPNIEVMGAEKKEGAVSLGEMVNVFILSSGNQYHLSMVLQSDSDLLKRLMNKKVQDLDELVNNLKDFFRNTDWMFNDAEKKLYQGLSKDHVMEKVPSNKEVLSENSEDKTESDIPKMPSRPPISERPLPKVSGRLGKQSLEYFENLYKKGLIKEDIYNRLIVEYGHASSPIPSASSSAAPDKEEDIPEAVEEGGTREVSPPQPVKPPEEEEEVADDELLSMLDETLSDFTDEAEPVEKEKAPENKQKKVVRRVKRKVI